MKHNQQIQATVAHYAIVAIVLLLFSRKSKYLLHIDNLVFVT